MLYQLYGLACRTVYGCGKSHGHSLDLFLSTASSSAQEESLVSKVRRQSVGALHREVVPTIARPALVAGVKETLFDIGLDRGLDSLPIADYVMEVLLGCKWRGGVGVSRIGSALVTHAGGIVCSLWG